jgi:hypothetical protein
MRLTMSPSRGGSHHIRALTTITQAASNLKRPGHSQLPDGLSDGFLSRVLEVRVLPGAPVEQVNWGLTQRDARDHYWPLFSGVERSPGCFRLFALYLRTGFAVAWCRATVVGAERPGRRIGHA